MIRPSIALSRTAVAISLALLGALPAPATAGLANSVWPKFQHDNRHSGRTTVNGPVGPSVSAVPLWRARGALKAAPSVGVDGTIYAPNGKEMISAIDPDTGATLWSVAASFKGSLTDRSQATVTDDGIIYFGARDNDLWSVDAADGSINCRYHVMHDGDVVTSPTVASDGTIFMGSDALGAGWFYAMNPDCTVKWSIIGLGGSLKNVASALNQDESIVYISIKTHAIAINALTGAELWRVLLADKGTGSRKPNFTPVFANDYSAIYFVSKDGLVALDPADGSQIWSFVPPHPLNKQTKEIMQSAPAIGVDGTIYIGASLAKKSNHLYALDPADGSIKWSHSHTDKGRYQNSQAVVGADGTVYVAFGKGTVYAFAGQGNGSGGSVIKWQTQLPAKFEAGPIIGAPGVLYVGAGKFLFEITDTP